jgi:hypothetical protein
MHLADMLSGGETVGYETIKDMLLYQTFARLQDGRYWVAVSSADPANPTDPLDPPDPIKPPNPPDPAELAAIPKPSNPSYSFKPHNPPNCLDPPTSNSLILLTLHKSTRIM